MPYYVFFVLNKTLFLKRINRRKKKKFHRRQTKTPLLIDCLHISSLFFNLLTFFFLLRSHERRRRLQRRSNLKPQNHICIHKRLIAFSFFLSTKRMSRFLIVEKDIQVYVYDFLSFF